MRIAWLKDLRLKDLNQVGGKNASLGEMIGGLAAAGIRVPGGFATTADAYREFLATDDLAQRIEKRLRELDPKDIGALEVCGAEIRSWILNGRFPRSLVADIKKHYQELEKNNSSETSYAVRSSATAEDLPDASFAAPSARSCRRWCSAIQRKPGVLQKSLKSKRKNETNSLFPIKRCSSSRAARRLSSAITAARWISNGGKTAPTGASTFFKRVPRPSSRASAPTSAMRSRAARAS